MFPWNAVDSLTTVIFRVFRILSHDFSCFSGCDFRIEDRGAKRRSIFQRFIFSELKLLSHRFLENRLSMKTRRVAVTGMGLVSPLSLSLETFWNRLISGEGATRPFQLPDASEVHARPIAVAAPALFEGDIEEFGVTDTAQKRAIKKALKVMSREIQMAVAASCLAVRQAEIQIGQFPAEKQGISFGSDYILTTVEDVIDGVRACCRLAEDGRTFDFSRWAPTGLPKMPPLWQLKYLPNMPASHIAILNNFHGPSNSITLREASIGAVVAESLEIIRSGRVDIMLIGTTGSRLHPVKMIQALQQEEIAPDLCRPFDRDRNGTVLGEGAGALVLEDWEHAEKRGATILAEIAAGSCRAHFGRNRSDGCRRAINAVLWDVLACAEMEPGQVGHVNAYGLGGRETDRVEAQVLSDLFGKRREPIPVAAAKGFFGNLGAGTGTIELIAGILALQKGVLYPSLNFEHPDPECPLALSQGSDIPAGDSFVKLAFNHQAQASAVVVKKA